MKTPNAILMVASMGRALFTVKVAVAYDEGKVGTTRAYIVVVIVGLANWIRRGRPTVSEGVRCG